MKKKEIYKFVKNIIRNGIDNELSITKVEEGIDDFIKILESQQLVDASYIKVIDSFKNYLELIMRGTLEIDEAYELHTKILGEMNQEKENNNIITKKIETKSNNLTSTDNNDTYSIGACGVTSSNDRCGLVNSDPCGSRQKVKSSNSCSSHSSYSSSCSSRSTSRC